VIEDHQIGFASRQHGGDFLHLALAGESLRVGSMTPPANFGNDLATRRLGQQRTSSSWSSRSGWPKSS